MKQFTKISLVTILSFIGVILTVMFRDVVFQAVGPAIGLFENWQPTPVAGTTVLFFWGMLVAMLPLLAVRLKWPARFHFQIRNDVNWKTVSPAIVAIIWAMSPQLYGRFPTRVLRRTCGAWCSLDGILVCNEPW